MKSSSLKQNRFLKDNKGVFGLTSVQAFFSIILAVALVAYVIVVIMGTLSNSNVIPDATASVSNETTGAINNTGYAVSKATLAGFGNFVVTAARNGTGGVPISSPNYTVNSATGVVTNATAVIWPVVHFDYTYTYATSAENQANTVLTNTSTGITGFFSAVNPVYAILAILVIILVLVVLVRVVTGSAPSSGIRAGEPQL